MIVLAVSGGCDSVGLFHGLLSLAETTDATAEEGSGRFFLSLGYARGGGAEEDRSASSSSLSPSVLCEVHVAHFDHRQRGTDSDADRTFVEGLCRDAGVPFHCFFWNDGGGDDEHDGDGDGDEEAKGAADRQKFSQETARDWRRSELVRLLDVLTTVSPPERSEGWGRQRRQRLPGAIFTAHHRDDSDETMMLKLLRGSHITNLSGMDVVRVHRAPSGSHDNGSKTPPSALFARPLLCVTKEDIVTYLRRGGWTWREDASNTSGKYLRNRVRNELLPLMSDLVGGRNVLRVRISRKIEAGIFR